MDQTHRPDKARSNVIWIFGDQHRGQALGCAGDPNLHTPNIDIMADQGAYFTAALSGFPLCCPFRGSLLTGRYPHKCVPGHGYRMPPEQPTVATAFREAGYHTAYFGKWHLDGFHERDGRAAMHIVPPERRGGFDTWLGYENNNAQWDSWVHGEQDGREVHFRLPGYETDALTDIFIEYVKERGRLAASGDEEPFFAALSVQPPHDPFVAPPEWMGRHTPGQVVLRENVPAVPRIVERARRDLAGYYSMIENLDWNIGRVRQALEKAGLAEDTHIIFFSDHGEMAGSHGQFRKTTYFEESIRVPFIISGGRSRYYGMRPGRFAVPINHVDIAPTTLGLCGLTPPEWMEGTDYSAWRLAGKEMPSEPDFAFLQNVIPTGHGDSVDRPFRGVVTADGWKYVALEGQPLALFNLNEDPLEMVNMAMNTAYRVQRRRLNDRLAAWINDTGDSFKLPEV